MELETAKTIKVECPASGDTATAAAAVASAVTARASADWCPQDDGIRIVLPGKAKASTTKEDVDAHIQTVLYGPDVKRRFPVFVEFCPEN